VRWAPAAVVLGVALTACANPPPANPNGPYAAASPGPAQAVINRGCANAAHEGPEATDVGFVKSSLLRQQAQLQRVADDLTGAVPGGNLPTDAGLAQANAKVIVDLVGKSTLCSPFREKLLDAARALAAADDSLVAGSATDTLQRAQAALDNLNAIAAHPPSPASSASP
jgi:hypothetical protein